MKKSVVLIYDYFSPAYKAGGPTQSLANMVKGLHDPIENGSDIDIKVICTNEDLDGTLLNVATDQWLPIEDANGRYGSIWYASRGKRDIKDMILETDIIFINSIFSYHFDYLSLLRSKARRKIVSPRGMLDPGSLSQKSWKKKAYLALWKLRGYHKYCEWHATTDQEQSNIKKVFGKNAKVWYVANFPRVMHPAAIIKTPGHLSLVTIALISPMKNHHLILQALKNVTGHVAYNIYGPVKDKEYWAECRGLIGKLPANVTVTYHGDLVPDMVQAALEKEHVAVIPSKSENFGHSIFEAFTAGRPVITSHFTPWNDLKEHKAGINVSINDTDEMTQAISFFAAMNQNEFEEWSKDSRQFAINAIEINSIKSGYLKMFV